MRRKEFLKQVSASALLMTAGLKPGIRGETKQPPAGSVITTTGSIPAAEMGFTLIHEHILSTFGTAPQEPAQFDEATVLDEVVPYLEYLNSLGCDTIVDCSAAYFGRNAGLMRTLSQRSGINLVINTGIYGAAGDDYVPDYAFREPADQLARRWIDEFNHGIQGTDVRPGFVKIGVDPGPLSDIDAKLVRAAALTHRETGLLLQIHTADNPEAAEQQLTILREEGVSPSAWVWVHAHASSSPKPLLKAARRGAWISLDGLRTRNYLNGYADSRSTLGHHFKLLKTFQREDLLDRVMLSHDGSTYPPDGTPKRPMDVLFNSFIPMLEAGGFSRVDIDRITRENPAEAFRVNIRTL